jgi:heme exporter protein C
VSCSTGLSGRLGRAEARPYNISPLLLGRSGVLKSALKAILLFVLIAFTAYLAFYYAPVEKTMGVIQKIWYLHVSCAFSSFVAFGICFYANLRYVFTRQPKADWLAVSAAEVGLAFISVVLITGPIWAHPVWGIWWTWDARLTFTFVLWLLYLSYLLLRSMVEEQDKRALFSALFGIFAFLDVPLVYFSIRWWRTQHPQPVILGGSGSGLDPRMRVSYLLMWGALTGLLILLLSARYRLEALRASVEELRREAEAR